MKAIRIRAFGGPEVLKMEETAKPAPAADEVLVKVYATSINPIDWKIREGMSKEKFPTTFPLTLGWDLAGVVEETGCDVNNFKPGDAVYGRPDPTRNGTYAEYIVVKANQISLKPESLDFMEAAAVPLAGLTAWQGLCDHGHLQSGQKVLIHAASGGVGSFAVQFAKWRGAYVIGTTSTANIDFVKELGADEVIDYKTTHFEEILKDIDLVLDTRGGDTQRLSLQVLKNGGRLVTTVKVENEEAAAAKNIEMKGYTAQSYPDQLKKIAQLIDDGKVKPVIAAIMPWAAAAEAQRLSKEGHVRGKIVLKVVV
jgi:NADPH:quinone reductase-like Zn-dependent oxidoreductase